MKKVHRNRILSKIMTYDTELSLSPRGIVLLISAIFLHTFSSTDGLDGDAKAFKGKLAL